MLPLHHRPINLAQNISVFIRIQEYYSIYKLHNLAETVRFELTVPFDTAVFKTAAINRTLPHFHNLVECTGIEPVVPKAADLQSTASPLMLPLHIWCPMRDSNSHA